MTDIAIPTEAAPSLASALLNTSHLPLLLFDGNLKVVSVTPSFSIGFGLDRAAVLGRSKAVAQSKSKGGLGTVIVESLAKQLGAHVVISDCHPGTKVLLESSSAHSGWALNSS